MQAPAPILQAHDGKSFRRLRWIDQRIGPLRVYRQPLPGKTYTIGVDVAEGKARDDEDPFAARAEGILHTIRDYSAAVVVDDEHGGIAATYHGDVAYPDLAADIYTLGIWYNAACLAIEVNSIGRGIQEIVHAIWGYPNVFVGLRRELLMPSLAERPEPGFRTTSKTRPLLIQLAAQYIADPTSRIPDARLRHELRTMEHDGRMKIRATGRNHDDLAIAFMIALYARSEKLGTTLMGPALSDPLAALPHNDRRVWESMAGRLALGNTNAGESTDDDW